MSPWLPEWSREHVVIGLAPERLTALALSASGGFRPQLRDRHAVPLPDQTAVGWEQGVAALDSLLAEPGWQTGAITVILSSHYVRHVIIPPSPGLADAERQSLAQVVFHEVFGDLARDWELRVSPSPPGLAALACGVPRPLLNSLRVLCEPSGRLDSIQPGLMPVFNRARREIGNSVACLALVEPGRVTLASVENGEWKYIDSRAGNGNILPQLLIEESELHERQPGGILWLCDLTETSRLPSDAFWSYRPINPPPLPGFDAVSSLALGLSVWGLA